jgi:excisionase family DNA binding protein
MIVKAIMREKSTDGKTHGVQNKDSEKLSSMSSVVDQQQEKLALTVVEAAKILGISRGSTYNAVRRGQIPNIRIGRRIVIPRASLINMLKEVAVEK